MARPTPSSATVDVAGPSYALLAAFAFATGQAAVAVLVMPDLAAAPLLWLAEAALFALLFAPNALDHRATGPGRAVMVGVVGVAAGGVLLWTALRFAGLWWTAGTLLAAAAGATAILARYETLLTMRVTER